jgi:hypothetical protein
MRFTIHLIYLGFLLSGIQVSMADIVIQIGSDDRQSFYSFDLSTTHTREIGKPENRNERPHPEMSPLLSVPQGKEIAKAYWHGFFDCQFVKSEETKSALSQTAETLDDAIAIASDLRIDHPNDRFLIVAGQLDKSAALIDRQQMSTVPPSCAAATRFYRKSDNGAFVAFVDGRINSISFMQGNRKLWGAKYENKTDIFVYDLESKPVNSRRITVAESVLDASVMNDGRVLLILANQWTNWLNPSNWLYAIGGHAEKKSDIDLALYDNRGNLVYRQSLMKGVVRATASFF